METIKNLVKDGKEKLHILADFDGTLTKQYVNGKEVSSAISILRDSEYISKDYAKKAHELRDKYMPIEKNPDICIEEKKKIMLEWWIKHFDLLIKSGLNKKHLENVVQDKRTQFKDGVKEFMDILYKNKIPLIIMSSSGIGEVIPMLLKRDKLMHDNVHVITNYYNWDKNGNAISVKKPIIHSLSKDEAIIKDYPFYNKVKDRKNVILLGNAVSDLEMIKGFDYNNLLKIGFLKEKDNKFDVCLDVNDSFDYINKLMKEILND